MPKFSAQDCAHMARALRLAARGRYTTHPNPRVGCVVVQDGQVVGEGWHERAGEAHAEINALQAAGERARGASVFVSLEPCAHHGRTPPCADALIAAGVARVVVAVKDSNPAVDGDGLKRLEAAGIDVQHGLMESAAVELNRGFLQRMRTGRPHVQLKVAVSIDGATAMRSGESQWITGAAARRDVQRQRAESAAVMTGIGTVLADDPSLNVRDAAFATALQQPLRVVLDSKLRMPADAGMLALPGDTLVCCIESQAGSERAIALQEAGAEVLPIVANDGKVSLDAVLDELGRREINQLLVEAGPELSGALLSGGAVDEIVLYQAPVLLGSETRRMLLTPDWHTLADGRPMRVTDTRRLGDDLRLTLQFAD